MNLFISAFVALITSIITTWVLYRLKTWKAKQDDLNAEHRHRRQVALLRTLLQPQEIAYENHHNEQKGAPLNQTTHPPELDLTQTADMTKDSPPYTKHP